MQGKGTPVRPDGSVAEEVYVALREDLNDWSNLGIGRHCRAVNRAQERLCQERNDHISVWADVLCAPMSLPEGLQSGLDYLEGTGANDDAILIPMPER